MCAAKTNDDDDDDDENEDGDNKDDDDASDNVENDLDRRSCRAVWMGGKSFFEGVHRDMFVLSTSSLREEDEGGTKSKPEPEKFRYEPGEEIVHGGSKIGAIVKLPGRGNYGTVYLLERPDGSKCAAKAIREDFSKKDRIENEKALASEVSIGFALGKGALVASVISILVPLPEVTSTAKGMMLLCDLVDGGDLEEAMSTKEAVSKEDPDYKGFLYTDEGMARWPLASLSLQIFTAFGHIHSRGIIHQDFKPANLMLCLNGLAKVTDFGECRRLLVQRMTFANA